jgi:hypothetical protein
MARMTSGRPVPTLTPTGSGASYRLPALAIGMALVLLVGLTRLGGTDRPTPTAVPSGAAAVPTAAVSATPKAPTSTITLGRLAGVMRRSPDGLTYADGIPTGISGQPVYRVRDVLLVPVGRTMLVGGWYFDQPCGLSGVPCFAPALSDAAQVEVLGGVILRSVALDSNLNGAGAHIVLATIEDDPRCLVLEDRDCRPRLRVLQQIWSGLG